MGKSENTHKMTIRLSPITEFRLERDYRLDGSRSKNEFIEKAIHFYVEHLAAEESSRFLPSALVAALRSTVQGSENRIARLLFKLTVEISMMMHVLAAGLEIDNSQLDDLRWQCVQEVKKTNGGISFKDTLKRHEDE